MFGEDYHLVRDQRRLDAAQSRALERMKKKDHPVDTPRNIPYADPAPQPPPSSEEDHMQRGRGRLSDSEKLDEILSRTRRLETRTTAALVALGYDSQAQKPEFRRGALFLPSPHSSLKECINSIPKDWPDPVLVFVGDDHIATLDPAGNRSG